MMTFPYLRVAAGLLAIAAESHNGCPAVQIQPNAVAACNDRKGQRLRPTFTPWQAWEIDCARPFCFETSSPTQGTRALQPSGDSTAGASCSPVDRCKPRCVAAFCRHLSNRSKENRYSTMLANTATGAILVLQNDKHSVDMRCKPSQDVLETALHHVPCFTINLSLWAAHRYSHLTCPFKFRLRCLLVTSIVS